LGLLLLLTPLVAQDQQTISVTTRLLEVSVVAKDQAGRPVGGLTQENFTVYDNGEPQKLSFFAVESTEGRTPPPGKVPPNIYSNRFERLGGYPNNATVILFDALNTRLTDQAYARRQIVDFLQKLRPEDLVALYVVGRGPRVIQDFNGDTSRLLETLENYKGTQDPSARRTPRSTPRSMTRLSKRASTSTRGSASCRSTSSSTLTATALSARPACWSPSPGTSSVSPAVRTSFGLPVASRSRSVAIRSRCRFGRPAGPAASRPKSSVSSAP
jgi:VWFA-related protein